MQMIIILMYSLTLATEYIPNTIPPKGGYCSVVDNYLNGDCTETDNTFTLTNEFEGLHYESFWGTIEEAGMNEGDIFARNICLMALYGLWDPTQSKWGDLVDATYVTGGDSYSPLVGGILTERYLPRIHDSGAEMEYFMRKDNTTKIQTWKSVTCTWKARDYELTDLVWEHCANVKDSPNNYCYCRDEYIRLKRSDSQYYYPLNKPPADSTLGAQLACEENSFGVEGGLGESCECGFLPVCEDASEIHPEYCQEGVSEQWNFKLDCPSAENGLDITMYYDKIASLDVYVNDEKIKNWGVFNFRQQLDVSLNSGENEIYWNSDSEFSILKIKLHNTQCTISFDSTGADGIMDQVSEHVNNFVDKLKDGDATSIGIVAAAVLVPLLCCCLIWCCASSSRKQPKVVYRV